jgi:hypothetical protein
MSGSTEDIEELYLKAHLIFFMVLLTIIFAYGIFWSTVHLSPGGFVLSGILTIISSFKTLEYIKLAKNLGPK